MILQDTGHPSAYLATIIGGFPRAHGICHHVRKTLPNPIGVFQAFYFGPLLFQTFAYVLPLLTSDAQVVQYAGDT